ncbi:MAG: lipid-A-disaccharide synthase [Gammaproteobacteria bacterium]
MLTVGVIAGEASGSALGAGLMRALQSKHPQIRFVGVGGDDMAALGAELWLPAQELAVMGLVEVLRHLPRLLRHRRMLRQRFLEERIDVFVGIDLPDFNLGVAKWLRQRGVPTLQYVSPSVWAWREKRVKTIRMAVDEVLCLLPFEVDFYARHTVRARFVGHPLADDISAAVGQGEARAALEIGPDDRVLCVMPGSRQGEVRTTGPVFAQAAARLVAADSQLHVIVPIAHPSLEPLLRDVFAQHAPGVTVGWQLGEAHRAMAASDVVLLASGTATLEAMLIGRPMVVGYRLAAATSFLLRRFSLLRIEYFSLPNLLAGKSLVPEFMQESLTVGALVGALRERLYDDENNAQLLMQFDQLRGVLANDASAHAAQAVLEHAGAVSS